MASLVQGHTQARNLAVFSVVSYVTATVKRLYHLTAGRSVHANDIIAIQNVLSSRYRLMFALQGSYGYFDHNGVAVESRHGVAGILGANCTQIEDTKIHKERIVHGTGENFLARAGRHDPSFHLTTVSSSQSDGLIVDGTGADIGRRHDAIGNDRLESLPTIHTALTGIGGFQVFFTQANVEESRGVFIHLLELETIDDIRTRRTRIIIHMHFVPDVFPERIPVGSTSRVFEWDVIGDQYYVLVISRASECVHISVVSQWVIRNKRSLAV